MPTATQRKQRADICPRCNGARSFTRMEPKVWGSGKTRVVLYGHKVPKLEVCTTCDGTGRA